MYNIVYMYDLSLYIYIYIYSVLDCICNPPTPSNPGLSCKLQSAITAIPCNSPSCSSQSAYTAKCTLPCCIIVEG